MADTTTPRRPGRRPGPRLQPPADADYRAAYEWAWKYAGRDTATLDHLDACAATDAAYDGYLDRADGRAKWHLAYCADPGRHQLCFPDGKVDTTARARALIAAAEEGAEARNRAEVRTRRLAERGAADAVTAAGEAAATAYHAARGNGQDDAAARQAAKAAWDATLDELAAEGDRAEAEEAVILYQARAGQAAPPSAAAAWQASLRKRPDPLVERPVTSTRDADARARAWALAGYPSHPFGGDPENERYCRACAGGAQGIQHRTPADADLDVFSVRITFTMTPDQRRAYAREYSLGDGTGISAGDEARLVPADVRGQLPTIVRAAIDGSYTLSQFTSYTISAPE